MGRKNGGSNKACSWDFFYSLHKKQYLWQVSQKLINVEVLIRHVNCKYIVGKIFSEIIRKTPCLLETSEYMRA